MKNVPADVPERDTLTFCVAGLAIREELLVKAFVRLLDCVTLQKWQYQPPSHNARVDLLLAAPGSVKAFVELHGEVPASVLELSRSGHNGRGQLSWPLSSEALQSELNRLGRSVLAASAASRSVSGTLVGPDSQSSQITLPDNRTPLRLQRWPAGHLLEGSGKLRLATLLAGKAITLDDLVHRSGLPLLACQTFVRELLNAGLLNQASAPATNKDSLHTRGLGLSQSLGASGFQGVSLGRLQGLPAAKSCSVQPGLIERIRLRLGIGGIRQAQ